MKEKKITATMPKEAVRHTKTAQSFLEEGKTLTSG